MLKPKLYVYKKNVQNREDDWNFDRHTGFYSKTNWLFEWHFDLSDCMMSVDRLNESVWIWSVVPQSCQEWWLELQWRRHMEQTLLSWGSLVPDEEKYNFSLFLFTECNQSPANNTVYAKWKFFKSGKICSTVWVIRGMTCVICRKNTSLLILLYYVCVALWERMVLVSEQFSAVWLILVSTVLRELLNIQTFFAVVFWFLSRRYVHTAGLCSILICCSDQILFASSFISVQWTSKPAKGGGNMDVTHVSMCGSMYGSWVNISGNVRPKPPRWKVELTLDMAKCVYLSSRFF